MRQPLDQLLDDQQGVLSSRQAAALGYSRHVIQRNVTASRWQRPLPGVYVTHTGPLTPVQKIWVGLLYAGPPCVASHESALWLADQKQQPPPLVHLLIPDTRKVARQSGLHLHRSRTVRPDDLLLDARPPRVRVERAVLDAAAACVKERDGLALLAQTVQRRLTTARRVLTRLEGLPCLPHHGLFAETLWLCDAGAESLIELLQHRVCAAHCLPSPQRQVLLGPGRADGLYRMPKGELVVELDGRAGHFDSSDWWADMFRDNAHTAEGRLTLRFPGFILLGEPWIAAHMIGDVLRVLGWEGRPRCPRACPSRVR